MGTENEKIGPEKPSTVDVVKAWRQPEQQKKNKKNDTSRGFVLGPFWFFCFFLLSHALTTFYRKFPAAAAAAVVVVVVVVVVVAVDVGRPIVHFWPFRVTPLVAVWLFCLFFFYTCVCVPFSTLIFLLFFFFVVVVAQRSGPYRSLWWPFFVCLVFCCCCCWWCRFFFAQIYNAAIFDLAGDTK